MHAFMSTWDIFYKSEHFGYKNVNFPPQIKSFWLFKPHLLFCFTFFYWNWLKFFVQTSLWVTNKDIIQNTYELPMCVRSNFEKYVKKNALKALLFEKRGSGFYPATQWGEIGETNKTPALTASSCWCFVPFLWTSVKAGVMTLTKRNQPQEKDKKKKKQTLDNNTLVLNYLKIELHSSVKNYNLKWTLLSFDWLINWQH